MAITRMQMNRQLYGIGNLVDREKYGLGSSLKKFVRNIIPNEVAEVATTVAPFIAPFDPATAAVLSSVGTFDQTGSMSGSLKAGALTYGGGQLARFIGGADFQALPGTSGFTGRSLLSPSAYSSGIMSAFDPRTAQGLTTPTGTKTGLGKFLSGEGTETVKAVKGMDVSQGGEFIGEGIDAGVRVPDVAMDTSVVSQTAADNITNIAKGQDILNNAFELVKKGAKAAFTTTDAKGNTVIDKKAVIASVAGAASYMEAKTAAANLGVDLTESEYDEAAKATKKAEYSGYLKNFFSGKKDGGRIGFEDGSDDPKKVPPVKIGPDDLERILKEFQEEQERQERIRKKYYGWANGGRIGFEDGTGNMGVVTKGLPEAAYEQKDQTISYMDPKAKQGIFDTISKMEPDSRMSVIEFMLKSGKMSDDDYKEFLDMLKSGVEDEETRITKEGGGGAYTPEQVLKMKRYLFSLDDNPDILVMDDDEIVQMYLNLERDKKANGGKPKRKKNKNMNPKTDSAIEEEEKYYESVMPEITGSGPDKYRRLNIANGGRIGFALGDGVMSLPIRQNSAGVEEIDYRDNGGFVPVGVKERADDVPAMLSKNEFVITADAVRGIGNGSVENGAQKLYNMMKEAEKIGRGVGA